MEICISGKHTLGTRYGQVNIKQIGNEHSTILIYDMYTKANQQMT